MSSLKMVLRKKANKDGTFPLAIRVTKNRVSSYIYIGHSIPNIHWDSRNQKVKKSYRNSSRLNNLLSAKFAEANDKLLELETQKNDATSKAIKKGFVGTKDATFFKQAEVYLKNLEKTGKFNRLSADQPRINRFREFLDEADIAFPEITVSLLKRFRTYLNVNRAITERTIVNHLVVIRTIYNQAISENLVDRKHYPFGKGKITIKFPDSLKIGLTPEEVRTIEQLNLPAGPLNHARNVWLFSFYFAGMRVSDVLRLTWADFQNDRLYYKMGKNAKAGSLKVPEKALNIINAYRRENPINDFVFPDLETVADITNPFLVQMRIAQRNKKINEDLEEVAKLGKISKKLTMHIARHTFGNISGDRIPIQMLQKLYRHTSITTTIGYQSSFIHKNEDEALEAVIRF